MENVHYIAAAAAMSLHDFNTVQEELGLLLKEDPANPLAPIAQKQLDLLTGHAPHEPEAGGNRVFLQPDPSANHVQTFPDSEYLHAQLEATKDVSGMGDCGSCGDAREFAAIGSRTISYRPAVESSQDLFTIHRAVDETAVFFSVSRNGHPVNDLGPDEKALEQSLGKLRDVIRNHYLVAYKAAHFAPNGKYHSIRMSAAKNGSQLQVHVRKGYYARLAQSF